jgi:hypothetical protein
MDELMNDRKFGGKRMTILRLVLPFIMGLSLCFHANAQKLIAISGKAPVQLIELYTSESCSSCPPADKWAATLKDRPGLWKKFVPVVFHVDYWNDLGWKDGLSANSMTKRQQDVAQTWTAPSVYTPAVVVDGREWREWPSGQLPENSKPTKLQLSVYKKDNGDFEVAVDGIDQAKYIVRIAKLGMGLRTNITGGENSGRLLEHNFVVLNWDAQPMTSTSSRLTFHLGETVKSPTKTAIAVWIEKSGTPVPLQAAGGYL